MPGVLRQPRSGKQGQVSDQEGELRMKQVHKMEIFDTSVKAHWDIIPADIQQDIDSII